MGSRAGEEFRPGWWLVVAGLQRWGCRWCGLDGPRLGLVELGNGCPAHQQAAAGPGDALHGSGPQPVEERLGLVSVGDAVGFAMVDPLRPAAAEASQQGINVAVVVETLVISPAEEGLAVACSHGVRWCGVEALQHLRRRRTPTILALVLRTRRQSGHSPGQPPRIGGPDRCQWLGCAGKGLALREKVGAYLLGQTSARARWPQPRPQQALDAANLARCGSVVRYKASQDRGSGALLAWQACKRRTPGPQGINQGATGGTRLPRAEGHPSIMRTKNGSTSNVFSTGRRGRLKYVWCGAAVVWEVFAVRFRRGG